MSWLQNLIKQALERILNIHTLAVTVTWRRAQADDKDHRVVEKIIINAVSSAENELAAHRFLHVKLPNDPPCIERTS